jgi:hypothetical protein
MQHAPRLQQPRRFHLVRNEDATGVSGTGIVARGIEFPSGYCLMQWVVPPAQSIAIYENVDDLIKIHGHSGKTLVEYIEDEPSVSDLTTRLGIAAESTVVALHSMSTLALNAA